jgi:type I restriction enzyme, S subunit
MREWKETRVEDIVQGVASGGTPKAGDSRYYSASGIPFLKIDDLTRSPDRFVREASQFITAIAVAESPAKPFPTGTVLVTMYGTMGLIKTLAVPMATNQAIAALLPPFRCDPNYLAHALTYARPRLERFASQTTQPNLSGAIVRSFKIPEPPLDEQRRIAEMLDTIDETIQATERVIAKLLLSHDALLRSLLAICDNGQRKSLRGFAEVSGGIAISTSRPISDPVEVPYLRVANVQDGFIDTTVMRTVRVSKSDINRYSVETGDVLMNEGGDFDKLGRGAVWDGRVSPCLHQNHVFRVRCKRSLLVPEFLSLFCQSAEGKAYFVSSSKQTTNLASINKTQIESLPTLVPSLESQNQIVDTQRASKSTLEAETYRLMKLEFLRTGLAADLLSGRVRTVAQ